ncbi:MAG: zinc ribbon domain-containing protein [Deltaproteobacteria bacterium]|nr:zinc ribbon domain-containing protein [Deltaproteobacteria bacterium]
MSNAPKEPLMGPSCQSCGLPLMRPSDFGKEANGVLKIDYCGYCYDKGRFTEPDLTIDQMADKLAVPMAEKRGMPVEAAWAQAKEVLVRLKRWRAREAK